MKSMETGRQDGGSDKNHAPFSVGKTGNISRKFLTIILKIFDKNFERLHPIIRPLGDEKYEMVSVGPTTSMRMEKFEYEFVKETGVRVVVGIRKDSCAGVHRSFSVLQISSFRLS